MDVDIEPKLRIFDSPLDSDPQNGDDLDWGLKQF